MQSLLNGSQFDRLINRNHAEYQMEYGIQKTDLKVIRNIRNDMEYIFLKELIDLGVYEDRELADSIMRLRAQGLLEFTRNDEDIHEMAFKLTKTGTELWNKIDDDYNYAADIMFGGMTEEQMETYDRLSQMIIENINNEIKIRGQIKKGGLEK